MISDVPPLKLTEIAGGGGVLVLPPQLTRVKSTVVKNREVTIPICR